MRNVYRALLGALWKFFLIICQCHFFKWSKYFLHDIPPLIPILSLLSIVEVFLGLQILHRPHTMNNLLLHANICRFFSLSQFSCGFDLSSWSKTTSCLPQFVIYFDHEKLTSFKRYWVRNVLMCVSWGCWMKATKLKARFMSYSHHPEDVFKHVCSHNTGSESFKGEREIVLFPRIQSILDLINTSLT